MKGFSVGERSTGAVHGARLVLPGMAYAVETLKAIERTVEYFILPLIELNSAWQGEPIGQCRREWAE